MQKRYDYLGNSSWYLSCFMLNCGTQCGRDCVTYILKNNDNKKNDNDQASHEDGYKIKKT